VTAVCASCGRELEDGLCPGCDSPTQSRTTHEGGSPDPVTPATVPDASAPFPELAGYRRLGILGAGGMGVVYLALDETLRRQVAIKVTSVPLAQDPQARQRFLREARSMAAVEHAHIVRVYSFGETEGRPYLVMEHVRGESLAQRLRRGPLPEAEVRRLARQVVLALQAAWAQHLIHRDIKPSNILLDAEGQARVADFGLAKPLEASEASGDLTGTQAVVGTPHYLAPEQARGLAVDFRADVYALGILLFEMLTGEKPFRASTPFGLLDQHVHEPLPSIRARRPETSEGMERLVRRMTEKDPQARPGSYAEILEALDRGSPSAVHGAGAADAAPRPARRTLSPRLQLLAAAALAALAVGFAVWRSVRWATPRPEVPPGASPRLVVAVTPFYGPDPDSAREGRVMASLVEHDLGERFPPGDARVIGIEEAGEPARGHEAARALGERLGASVVVWGRALTVRGETELQPSFTLVPPPARPGTPKQLLLAALRGQPGLALEQQGQAVVMGAQPSSPIELRKTSAKEVGDAVLLLAARHALNNEKSPAKALRILERAPRTAETLRCRAQALFSQREDTAAFATLQETLALDPADRTSEALLGDLYQLSGRFSDAVAAYRKAVGPDGVVSGAGFVHEGLLHVRELGFSAGRSYGWALNPTGYLVGIDPVTGRVRTRHRLPGLLVSVARTGDAFSLSYLPEWTKDQTSSIRFAGGRLDRPVSPGSQLLLRRLLELSCDARTGDHLTPLGLGVARPPGTPRPPGPTPKTIVEIEAFLRKASERDPTNPWWPFLLGVALWKQERTDEAGQAWETTFAPEAFPALLYTDFSFMSARLESLGLRDWADRAYASALARRRTLAQPVESAFSIDRLIAAFFVHAAGDAVMADTERRYVLLERARELTGVDLEADAFAALAWESHFRRKGDAPGAAREAAWFERARRNPLEGTGLAASLDYAAYLLMASLGAAWGLLLCALLPRGETGAAARWSPRALLARPSRPQRLTLLAACSLAFVAAGWLICLIAHVESLASAPLGLNDSLGDEAWIRWFDDRLSRADLPAAVWASAVAHHLGGDVPRARELYLRLPGDPRAQENLAVLQRGDLTPAHPVTAADIHAATFGRWWAALGTGLGWILLPGVSATTPPHGIGVIRWLVGPPLLVAVMLMAGWRFAGRAPAPPAEASRRAPWLSLLVPGVWDARFGRAVRGWLVLLMVALVIAAAALQASFGGQGALGLATDALFHPSRSVVLPPEGLSPWTRTFGYPHARLFWGLVAASALAVPVLHLLAIRQRRRRMTTTAVEDTR
jgi:tetratricopeptide (TPR) repeat protein